MTLRAHVHCVLVVALFVSVAANVSAAEPTIIGRCVAAWPPLALMLVVDVLGRVPSGPGWLSKAQILGATGVASVAGVASFSHMQAVALNAGESKLVAFLFPLTVDGLAVVCSAALVELNRRTTTEPPAEIPTAVITPDNPVPAVPPVSLNGHTPPLSSDDVVVWV